MEDDSVLLSEMINKLWGKLSREERTWLPLGVHLSDTGEVAKLLWDNWASEHVKKMIDQGVEDSPNDLQHARKIFVFLAAVHDLGKASPIFCAKAIHAGFEEVADRLEACGLACRFCADKPGKEFSHAYISQAVLEAMGLSRGYADIVGGHHGKPADTGDAVQKITRYPRLTGFSISPWKEIHEELVHRALQLADLQELPQGKLSIAAQVLLSGLLIMADWIASGEAFSLLPLENLGTRCSSRLRARRAWQEIHLPERTGFSDLCPENQLFEKRFGIASPRPMQRSAVEMAEKMAQPGIMVIEAPMGEGKTEAALAAAEVMARKFGQTGIYFALPTQATSDGIFKRIENWIRSLHSDGIHSIYLAHGKSGFNKDYEGIQLASNVEQYDGDGREENLIVHDWTQGRKKGMLSDFAVGTVDQILLCGLKQKHLAMRHLGVANKIVIVDECHAYDTYMSSYLALVLSWLGSGEVPVILLSATLPAERRQKLVEAYQSFWGCLKEKKTAGSLLDRIRKKNLSAAPTQTVNAAASVPSQIPYPLLTGTSGKSMWTQTPPSAGTPKKIQIKNLQEGELVSKLQELLQNGGCAGIIRDTVKDAQKTARILAAVFGKAQVRLLHSRFLACDRVAKEAEVRKLLGPGEKQRPHKLIVVGTQVMEQSLDVDFDVLFTDICPMDLLLQRMGRLHRHKRKMPRPVHLQQPACYILGMEGVDCFSAGPKAVYGQYLLMRTAAFLKKEITLPGDIPLLVAETYNASYEKLADEKLFSVQKQFYQAMEEYRTGQAKKRNKAEIFQIDSPKAQGDNLIGWLKAKDPDQSEIRGQATVRDTDDSLEVLVVIQKKDGFFYTVPHLDTAPDYADRRILLPDGELEKTIAGCSVVLPREFTAFRQIDRSIRELEETMVQKGLRQWYDSYWLQGELFLVLNENGQGTLNGKTLHYDAAYGLEVMEEAQKNAGTAG